MRYFKLNPSIEKKVVGKFLQCSGALSRGNIDDLNSRMKISEKVITPEILMENKSKTTSFLSTWVNANWFLILDKIFVDFLKNFNIGHFNHWALKVHHHEQILTDYVLFHLSYPTSSNTIIDYKESNFVVLPRVGWDNTTITKPVELKDFKSYLNLKEVLNESDDNLTISYTNLVLDFSNTTEDLIRFIDVPFQMGYYVSEKLKNAIEEQRFTGMHFQEIEDMDRRIKAIF